MSEEQLPPPKKSRKGIGGRPRKQDRDFKGDFLANVESLAALGMDLSDIAAFLKIRPETLSRYRKRFPSFDQAILSGTAKSNAKVTQALFKNATEKNNYFAQQFWLRNRAPKQWKEKVEKQIEMVDIKVKPPSNDIILPPRDIDDDDDEDDGASD